MHIKKIKRICGVRGCKNTEVYAISKSRDMGNSVIICKECLKDALESIDNYVEPVKVKRETKPLFYHPELAVTPSSVAHTEEPKPQEVIEDITEVSPLSAAEGAVTIDKPITTTPTTKATTKKSKKK